jgi:hypothetical protein
VVESQLRLAAGLAIRKMGIGCHNKTHHETK